MDIGDSATLTGYLSDNKYVTLPYIESNIISNGLHISKLQNTGTFSLPLRTTPSASYFGEAIVMNASWLGAVNFSTSISATKWAGASGATATAAMSGNNLVVTFTGTLWGITVVLWGTN